jgi:Mlc titration factor MtfA (ptsG expression regulator)
MLGRWRDWLKQRRIDALKKEISAEQWTAVEARLPLLAHLSTDERQRLRELALRFLIEKQMSTARGLQLHANMQLSIALQACLLVLHLGLDWYDDWVGIVIYPGDFMIPREIIDKVGVAHHYDDQVLGEAWQGGPVLISWFDDPLDTGGTNVVIHEFAHQIDMRNGIADGFPPLHADMSRQAWHNSFANAYADFCARVDRGEDTLIDAYAAETPAEFFAVMSEAFFETPHLLHNEYPAVYTQLRQFYRQHPAIH